MHAKPLLFIIGLVSFLSISIWTPPVIISTHPDNISYTNSWPEMAGDAAGNTSVVWQGYDGNDEEIYWVKVFLPESRKSPITRTIKPAVIMILTLISTHQETPMLFGMAVIRRNAGKNQEISVLDRSVYLCTG